MIKNILITTYCILLASACLADGLEIMTERCIKQKDSLNVYNEKVSQNTDNTTAGRNLWFKKCYGGSDLAKQIDEKGALHFKYGQNYVNAYVALGYVRTDTKEGEDPVVVVPSPAKISDPCISKDLDKHKPIGMCVGGCYERDQEVLFEDGPISIGSEAAKNQSFVATLTKNSTIENPILQMTPLEQIVSDRKPVNQDILEIKTDTPGKYSVLKVTTNHPLVVSEGYMKRAEDIKPGDRLVRYDGSLATVLDIRSKQIFDKVYNVMVASGNARENVVIGQGYLNGSIYFQNGDFEKLNRELVRSSDTYIDSKDLRGSK
jgi:hypothetical protein